MVVKADLKIVLEANEVIIAESNDKQLWQKVFAAINAGATKVGSTDVTTGFGEDTDDLIDPSDLVSKFSKYLDITMEEAIGSCDPSKDPPYIHLDNHHWENLKKNTPARGPKAISATVLALTLLVLWKKIAGLDDPTLKEAKEVRNTISAGDKNPQRTVKNCEWLQERHSLIRLNPSQTSKAIMIAKAYCQKTPVSI